MGPMRGLLYGRCMAGAAGHTDTLDPGQFRSKPFWHYQIGAKVSRDFSIGAEMFLSSAAVLHCLDFHQTSIIVSFADYAMHAAKACTSLHNSLQQWWRQKFLAAAA